MSSFINKIKSDYSRIKLDCLLSVHHFNNVIVFFFDNLKNYNTFLYKPFDLKGKSKLCFLFVSVIIS